MKREGKRETERERESERERGGGGDRDYNFVKFDQGTKTNIVGTLEILEQEIK